MAAPLTMADALGGLARRALIGRAWVLLPALLWWVLGRSEWMAHGPVSFVDGIGYAAFAAALGLVLRQASVAQRATTVGVCAVVFFTVPAVHLSPAEVVVHSLLLALPLAVAVLSRLRSRWLALLLTSAGVAAMMLAPHGAISIGNGWVATRLAWVGAVLSVSGLLIATRSRSMWVTAVALVAPSVGPGWEYHWDAAWASHPWLATAALVGFASRTTETSPANVAGVFVERLHNRQPLWGATGGFLLGWLVLPLGLGQATAGLPLVEAEPPITPGLALIALALGLSCVTLPLLASQRGSAFDRLATPPAVAFGLVAGLFADPRSFQWATGGWGQEAVTLTARMLLVFLAPSVVGIGLAFLTRRAGAIVLAALLGASLWAALDGRVLYPADTLLWVGFGLVLSWGAATRASQTVLMTLIPMAVVLALVTVSTLSTDAGLEPWSSSAPTMFVDYEDALTYLGRPWRLLLGSLEQLFLALAGGVCVADAIRLARTVFTSCPIPAWHPVRTDFADGVGSGVVTE